MTLKMCQSGSMGEVSGEFGRCLNGDLHANHGRSLRSVFPSLYSINDTGFLNERANWISDDAGMPFGR
jgi:hypothetical protein